MPYFKLFKSSSSLTFPFQAQFSNMSALIEYMNANQEQFGFHIQYSTAQEYFDALYATNITFPLLVGEDFEYGWPHVVGEPNYNGLLLIKFCAHEYFRL